MASVVDALPPGWATNAWAMRSSTDDVPAEGFGYGGFYAGDGRYGHVGHQHDRGATGQENRTVRNGKSDHPVSQGVVAAPSRRHKQDALKSGPSTDQPESSRERIGPRSESSADGEGKPDAEKNTEEVAVEQTRTGARTSSWWPRNWTVRFPKPDHPVSLASGQKKPSSTTMPGMAPAPHWYPPGLTPSQGRRIQWMRA
jgi:hypothetical protein